MFNLLDQANILKGLDDQTLQREAAAPSGGAPAFLVLSEINRRKDMRQRYAGQLAQRAPKTTVAQDLTAGLPAAASGMPMPGAAPGGLDAAAGMPQQPMQPQGFAGGGIVAAAAPSVAAPFDYASLVQAYQSDLGSVDAAKKRELALALLAAGAGIMGGGHSNTLQNVGVGINAGLNTYGNLATSDQSARDKALSGITGIATAQQNMADNAADRLLRQQTLDQQAQEAAAKLRPKFSTTVYSGVDENGDPATARFDTNSGDYAPNPRSDGTTPNGFTPYSAQEVLDNKATNKRTQTLIANKPLDAAGLKSADEQTQIALKTIDQVAANANWGSTGLSSTLTGDLGFGPAYDEKQKAKTLVSKIAIDAIQAMRAASKTGGALGNVSDKDMEKLEDELTNLDPRQNTDVFKENLATFRQHLQDALEIRRQQYADTYKEDAPVWSPATTPSPVGVPDPNRPAGAAAPDPLGIR